MTTESEDDPSRQAGASKSCLVLDETDAAALSFRSGDDARDYARKVVQRSRNWLALQNRHVAERYREGEFNLVLEATFGSDPAEYHLVFSAVPRGHRDGAPAQAPPLHSEAAGSSADGDQLGVLHVCDLVHGPQGVIPSLVRLERAKQRDNVIRQVFAAPFDHVSKFRSRVGERVVGALGVGRSSQIGASKAGLIESGSQTLNDLHGEVGEESGQRFGHLDLVKLIAAVRVFLNDSGIWFTLDESLYCGLEFRNLFLCAREPLLGAAEGIVGHGEIQEAR